MIVIPYEDNKEVVYATYLEKEYDWSTSDPKNCPADKIYVTTTFSKDGPFSKVFFVIHDDEKGKKDIEFSIGSDGKTAKSAPQKA